MSHPRAVYASFDGFLKATIETYWNRRRDPVHVIALLLASREAWEVAWDGIRAPRTGQRVLTGAAGLTAFYVALRLLVGGPVGLVLGGVSIASLAAVYAKNHRRIWDQQERYRSLIGSYRAQYDRIKAKYVEGVVDEAQRDLMIDGLMSRLLEDIDADLNGSGTGRVASDGSPEGATG